MEHYSGGVVILTEEEYLVLVERASGLNRDSNAFSGFHTLAETIQAIKGDRSIRKMVQDTGVASSYISQLTRGRYGPSLQILKKLVRIESGPRYPVSLDELIALCG